MGVGERSPPPAGGRRGWRSRVDPCEVRGFDQRHSPPPHPSPERGWELASAPLPLQGGGEAGGRALIHAKCGDLTSGIHPHPIPPLKGDGSWRALPSPCKGEERLEVAR